MTDLALKGCTYEPMSSYLSALAVLRLVSEQKDPEAKGWWDDLGVFHLESSLDEDGLITFFLEEYQPTPIVSPWNGGCGFYDKSKKKFKSIDAILNSTIEQLSLYRIAINEVFNIIKDLGITKSNLDSLKLNLIDNCRNRLITETVEWIDASTQLLSNKKCAYPPILGTGGNDGNLDFSNNFMSNLTLVFFESKGVSENLLRNAVFDDKTEYLRIIPVGQFDPTRTGGSNQRERIQEEDDYIANPWSYILTLEGTIPWTGSIAKRNNIAANENNVIRSPFTVRSVQIGYSSSSEYEKSRAEIWMPLWNNPTTYRELKWFLMEGRANVGKKGARNSIEFSEAATSLGIDRGISKFVRYSLLERRGNSYLALPAGIINVHYKEESDLIREINRPLSWIDSALRGDNIPARFTSARRTIDEKIYEVLCYGGKKDVKNLVSAIGEFEKLISLSGISKEPLIKRPISGLSPRWVKFADDGSLEVRIAAAIASIGPTGAVGSIRANISHVDPKKPDQWDKGRGQFAWEGNSIYAKMSSVLARRMMDADRLVSDGRKKKRNPLWGAIRLSIEDISAFIEGHIDEPLLENLIFGFSWIDWTKKTEEIDVLKKSLFQENGGWKIPVQLGVISRPYALLKLLFLPNGIKKGDNEIILKPEPSVIPLLFANRINDASKIAERRLVAKNFIPVTNSFPDGKNGIRISAALLIPVDNDGWLRKLVLKPEK